MSKDFGNIILVFADQAVPFQQPLRTLSRGDFFVFFESRMGSLDGMRQVFGRVDWTTRPGNIRAGILMAL